MTHSHKHKDQKHEKKNKGENNKKKDKEDVKRSKSDDAEIGETEVKDAHASGIGALGRSEENQIQKLGNNEFGGDDSVY